MKRIYKLTNGIATDLQTIRDEWPIPDGYISENDDGSIFSTEAKSDSQAWSALQAAKQAAIIRHDADSQEFEQSRQDSNITTMLNRTPAQINAFIDAQATDLAGVRAVLKIFAKLLIIAARRAFR